MNERVCIYIWGTKGYYNKVVNMQEGLVIWEFKNFVLQSGLNYWLLNVVLHHTIPLPTIAGNLLQEVV